VQGPEAFDGGGADSIDCLGIPYIGDDGVHGRTEWRRLFRERLDVDVRHDDAHALADEGLDERKADPARRAGDDGDATVEFLHGRESATAPFARRVVRSPVSRPASSPRRLKVLQ